MEGRKSPFDVIAGYSVNEGLGEALQQNDEYIAIQKRLMNRPLCSTDRTLPGSKD